MYLYYQTVENSRQEWLPILEKQAETVRREAAAHMGIYAMDKLPGSVDANDIKYKGHLWFDIDHTPTDKDPTEEDYQNALHLSLLDMRRLLSYFESIGLDPKYCELYASGGKGFHVKVPAAVFGATAPMKNLPKIHKHMASVIKDRSGAEGLDMQIYCTGKGRMLRVENKPRANGKYKVPVTYEEVKNMTPVGYRALTNEPRVIETFEWPAGLNSELTYLFSEMQAEQETVSKLTFSAIPSEQLAVFSDGDHPTCVDWITKAVNIKPGDGKFNRGKMSLSRYVMNAPITDAERNRLVEDFAATWHSDRNPTPEKRIKAVKETLTFGQEGGFSCSLMVNLLTESPCHNCKLKHEQKRMMALRSLIEESIFGYQRVVARGEGQQVSNFTLKPECQYVNDRDDNGTFIGFDYDVYKLREGLESPEVIGTINLSNKAWQSSGEFKRQISHITGVSWTGSDVDLQHLKAFLTNQILLKDIRIVKYVEQVGINYHKDPEREVDEYVWVEEGYSINAAKIKDTLEFNGQSGSTKGGYDSITLRLETIKPYNPEDEKQNQTLRALFDINTPNIVAPVLGWIYSCWLRTHMRNRETIEKHLPSLQIYGSSGHGKTETATLLSLLAGANYYNIEPLVVSSSTPYAIRVEGSLSLTVPRIFDEMNEHKISERNKYSAARETVKAAARGGCQRTGFIGEGGAQIDSRAATSPIIMLATQLNPEREINQRSIPVSINKKDRTTKHAECFKHARRNIDHIVSLCKTNMLTTLTLEMSWVEDAIARNHALIPEVAQDNRIGINWETALIGLDYFAYIMTKAKAPQDIQDRIAGLKDYLACWLRDNERFLSEESEAQEIDTIIDTFGEMIITDMSSRLKYGEHYLINGETLHIWSAVLFPQYVRYMREGQQKPPELTSLKQYSDLLGHQPYTLPVTVIGDKTNVKGWHSLHIPGLIERRIRVENFIQK